MSFMEKLRMSSLYPPNNSVGKAAAGPPTPMPSPFERQQMDHITRMNNEQYAQTRQKRMAEQNKPMDVVYDTSLEMSNRLTPKEAITFGQEQQKIDNQREYNQGMLNYREDKQAEDAEIRRKRAEVYEWKNKTNPNAKIIFQPGGDIIAVSPDGREVIRSFGPNDWSAEEIARFNRETQYGLADRNAANTAARDAAQGDRRLNEIVTGIQGGVFRDAVRPRNPQTPAEQRVEQFLKAREAISRNPNLAEYIEFSENGDFRLKQPSWNTNQAEYNQLVREIYDGNPPQDNTPQIPSFQLPPSQYRTPTSTTPSDKVEVIDPNGQRGRIPADRLPAYEAKGYKRVGK